MQQPLATNHAGHGPANDQERAAAKIEVFRPELHSFPLRAMLDEARDALGDAGLDEVLSEFGVRAADFRDKPVWVSLAFVEALDQRLVERVDPQIFERAMVRGISARYMGALYPLLVAFGTPLFTFRQLPKLTARMNKLGHWGHLHVARGHERISWTPLPGASQEQSEACCLSRKLQLSHVPVLFNQPPARVEHPSCMRRGDPICVYEIHWEQAHSQPHARLGLLAGAVVGLVASLLTRGQAWNLLLMSVGFGLAGWGVGKLFLMRGDLRRRIEENRQHSLALEAVTRTNEERFAELMEAKSAVEEKVEKRTAQLRATSQRLEETLLQVQALDRAKTDFFNNVSHELRSPLTLILSPLEDMAAGRTPPGGQSFAIAAMQRSAARLLQLINQLLDLAKIDAGEMRISLRPTPLAQLVHGVIQSFTAAAQAKGVKIELSAPAELAPLALDPPWIESACTNLIANALRLTPRGGSIRVAIQDGSDSVSVTVSDDGPGISQQDQARVFERFAQSDSTERNIGGTGIGLALVREAVRLHGGDVSLVSELGHGASFIIRLPRASLPPASAAPSAPSESPLHTERPPSAQLVREFAERAIDSQRPGPGSHAPLAFVVEDNPELREFLLEVLAPYYRVRSAVDGRAAVRAIRELRPDIVVSDVAMPEMDGIQLCQTLRDDPDTREIPIILVTARTELTSILAGFEAGASDYVLKPFHGRELLARVEVHVRLRRLVHEIAMRERHAVLGSMAASVAHQVRNPLTILISGLPAMRARLVGQLSDSANTLIDMMIDCSERIEQLTRDLLDLSRIDRSLVGDYSPSDGLRAAVRLMRAQLAAQLEIVEAIEDCPQLRGRAGDMNHVFLNLLDNAVRAIPPGGKILVSGRVTIGEYLVTIGDSGPGVPEELRARVFEPFFTTRPAGEGTGLGLSIARQVVVQTGGAIELGRSELGGAEFSVSIPLPESAKLPSTPPSPARSSSVASLGRKTG